MALKRLENGEIYFGEAKWTPFETINCLVQVEGTDEILEYHAVPDDVEEQGRELYEMLTTSYPDQIEECTEQERYDYFSSEALTYRNAQLSQSDWIANSDIQLENHMEWMQYRQDLRDITAQPDYPFTVVWPTKPEVTKVTPTTVGVTTAG